MNLLVVGAGAMGRWVADTVGADVAFADADESAAREAADSREARVVSTRTEEQFDAVCIAVPMSAAEAAISDHARNAETAMFDVTGAMASPVAAMRRQFDGERVSFHPLFAPENAPGNVAVFADESGPITDGVRGDVAAAGNRVFETTVEEHDEAMESVQAAAHAAVLSYALAAEDVREEFATPVSGDLDGLVRTVTEGNPQVYAEIQSTFPGAEAVAEAAARVADADEAAFADLYREAGVRHGADVNPHESHDGAQDGGSGGGNDVEGGSCGGGDDADR